MTHDSPHYSRRQAIVAALLVVCVLIVAFWEIMSNRGRAFSAGFELTNDDLRGCVPESDRWQIRSFPVQTTPMEPNIAAYQVVDKNDYGNMFLVRLVHGYNMCDCMRIKGYTVEPLVDTRLPRGASGPETKRSMPDNLQIWRLTSAGGDVSIWITTMLRAGGFESTGVDVRSMAFPRIGIPDDPGWMPRGITLRSFRHPLRNLRRVLRAKWNNSRCDPLTFLGLKQPVWASEEMLTLVSAYKGASVKPGEEQRVIDQAVEAHTMMLSELQRWRRERVGGQERDEG